MVSAHEGNGADPILHNAGARLQCYSQRGSQTFLGANDHPLSQQMKQLQASDVAGMGRRQFMNLLMFGSLTGVALGALYPVVSYFIPPKPGGRVDGTAAKDALGNDVSISGWLANHPEGDRSLVQGLKGDPTYLLVNGEAALAGFGVNAVCTHLGCVVPWDAGKNRFICPCHGSQYDENGKVVRGPAPLSLALAKVEEDKDLVFLKPWTETDFRTGDSPWWV